MKFQVISNLVPQSRVYELSEYFQETFIPGNFAEFIYSEETLETTVQRNNPCTETVGEDTHVLVFLCVSFQNGEKNPKEQNSRQNLLRQSRHVTSPAT